MYPGICAARTPDNPALIVAESGETLSFADHDANSVKLARYFGVGLQRGDVVALLAENDPRVFEVLGGAAFKAPRSIEFVSALPRTETGKLQKSSLMQRVCMST